MSAGLEERIKAQSAKLNASRAEYVEPRGTQLSDC